MSFLENYFMELPVTSPVWAGCLAGIGLVIIRWRKHPRPSQLAFWGLMALVFNTLVLRLLYHWLQEGWAPLSGNSPPAIYVLWGVFLLQNVITAVGIALLFLAVYSDRLSRTPRGAESIRDMDFPFDRPKRPLPEAVPVNDPETSIRERNE